MDHLMIHLFLWTFCLAPASFFLCAVALAAWVLTNSASLLRDWAGDRWAHRRARAIQMALRAERERRRQEKPGPTGYIEVHCIGD